MSIKDGLFNKYTIIDNRTGEKAEGNFFVLNPRKDEAARSALMQYALATKNKQLAMDITVWMSSLDS